MRVKVAQTFLAMILTSCASGDAPLTEAECRFMAEKEAVVLAGKFKGFPGMQGKLLEMASSRAAQCNEGNEFDREDYRCISAARDDERAMQCLKAAAKKSS